LGITDQPLASIAKREEWIYVYGQEDEPVVLDKFSPVLHVVQQIRDEAHRFAVTFHRTRRNANRLTSELHDVPGVGAKTVQKLLRSFGSLERVRLASEDELIQVIGKTATTRLLGSFQQSAMNGTSNVSPLLQIQPASSAPSEPHEKPQTQHLG
jgi:excinuclease ABC subunit C